MRVLLASSRRAGTPVPAAGADGGHKRACPSKSDLRYNSIRNGFQRFTGSL
jgi:hypothetical protein